MTWTLAVAIWGAVSGSVGTAVGVVSLRRSLWARRGRALDVRSGVTALRELLAEARADGSRAANIAAGHAFRARVSEIRDATARCPDNVVRKQLLSLGTLGAGLANTAATMAPQGERYALMAAIDQALSVATALLDRLDEIDRRLPG